jgi:hypothetical protein
MQNFVDRPAKGGHVPKGSWPEFSAEVVGKHYKERLELIKNKSGLLSQDNIGSSLKVKKKGVRTLKM